MLERRKCLGGCGRWLSSEESLARGYGRQCAERHGIPVAPPRLGRLPRPATRTADAPPEVHPEQTAIPLVDHQPSLWSI